MAFDIEEFDALSYYLTERGHVKFGETIVLEKLAGGVSNRTVRVAWPEGRAWVLKQALEKLRVDVAWFSSPERIGVEAKALRWLNRSAPMCGPVRLVMSPPPEVVSARRRQCPSDQ